MRPLLQLAVHVWLSVSAPVLLFLATRSDSHVQKAQFPGKVWCGTTRQSRLLDVVFELWDEPAVSSWKYTGGMEHRRVHLVLPLTLCVQACTHMR